MAVPCRSTAVPWPYRTLTQPYHDRTVPPLPVPSRKHHVPSPPPQLPKPSHNGSNSRTHGPNPKTLRARENFYYSGGLLWRIKPARGVRFYSPGADPNPQARPRPKVPDPRVSDWSFLFPQVRNLFIWTAGFYCSEGRFRVPRGAVLFPKWTI